MIFVECEQGTQEWLEARRGIPTASEFAKIITPKTGKLSASADKYIADLIAESIEPSTDFLGTYWTDRGHNLEQEARSWYEFDTENEVQTVGLILLDDKSAGVSPDGLVGNDGMIEIKCPKPSTHVYWYLKKELPDEHKPQCHAALLISGRKWLDFISYCPGFPQLVVRVAPDKYTDGVADALATFTKKLNEAKAIFFEDAA